MSFDTAQIETKNPARPDETVGCYPVTPVSEADAIVAAAQAAQKGWGATPQPERGDVLLRFLDALEAEKDALAGLITREMGKRLDESHGEVAKAIAEGRAMARRACNPVGEVLPSQTPGTVTYSTRRPRGVILGISPWNFPFSTPIRKAIPALLYGNAIILKPASLTPGVHELMGRIARDTLPEGILQTVVGGGSLGQVLAEHPGVHGVSFTGSVGIGKRVAAAAVSHLAEVSLELGGKNPAIVNDASDLDTVLDQVAQSAFAVSGQRCTAVSRVLANAEIADAVIRGLAERAQARTADAEETNGQAIGALSSAGQRDAVASFVQRAKAEGARIAAGGDIVETRAGGYHYAPTILAGVTPGMEAAREEIFGPVISVITYDDIDAALRIANDVSFGLSSCLYSEQSEVIERFIAESESGMLHVNLGSFPENHMPFVGIKDSALGVGGSNGASTIQFYTTEHAVYRKPRA